MNSLWDGFDGVERINGKLSGVPLLRGTRVPADLVAECLEAGESIEEIAYYYDLNLADVQRLKLYRDSRHAVAS